MENSFSTSFVGRLVANHGTPDTPAAAQIARPSAGQQKKPSFPREERRLSSAILRTGPGGSIRITHASHVARTQHLVHSTAGRSSDSRLTSRLLPIRRVRTVDRPSEISDLRFEISESRCLGDFRRTVGTDAYSGATVAEFHRVPVSSISKLRGSETCSRSMHFRKNGGYASLRLAVRQEENSLASGKPQGRWRGKRRVPGRSQGPPGTRACREGQELNSSIDSSSCSGKLMSADVLADLEGFLALLAI